MRRLDKAVVLAALLGAAAMPIISVALGSEQPQAGTRTNMISLQDTIMGKSFLAIQAAMKVVGRHRIDIDSCAIVVAGQDEAVLVIANDQNQPAGVQQNFGVRRGADTEMSDREVADLISNLDQIKPQEQIKGRSLRAIGTAAEVFLRRCNADLARYKIEVVRDGDSLVVIFTGKDVPPGTFGNIPASPGFEVGLKPSDLTVLRSSFIR
jgi:hypothetical protein